MTGCPTAIAYQSREKMTDDPYKRVAGFYDRLFEPMNRGLRVLGFRMFIRHFMSIGGLPHLIEDRKLSIEKEKLVGDNTLALYLLRAT